MKFQYMQLKFGKFVTYKECIVNSYESYVTYVENMNRKAPSGVSYITC